MSEPRKNHLTIDGGQVKEDDHVSSYKAIPESDTEFRSSKPSLSKSKEKLSSDGAEEKLLQKEDEAKITTRVDMADAKYVVGDHRNGDAKIELDANKRQFSGLTKEELLKYAEDPFWVRLRWFMFILFWALWLCMLAGAIAIIMRAPKCAPPVPKTWFEIGPLADRSSALVDYAELEAELPQLESSKVQAVFINPCEDTYEVLQAPTCLDKFKAFLEKAKKHSVKFIVDLTANFVPKNDAWFVQSENRSAEFADYFIWRPRNLSNVDGKPNNWLATPGDSAWEWSEIRGEFYLHQYAADRPDLNFNNEAVRTHFNDVLIKWMQAGAAGVRLHHARQLFVNTNFPNEEIDAGKGSSRAATVGQYGFLRHTHTSDQPQLDGLLAYWGNQVAKASSEETVFTIAEDGSLSSEWYLLERNASVLHPPSAAPVAVAGDMAAVAAAITKRVHTHWPAIQLSTPSADAERELASLALLLPASPVLGPLDYEGNTTSESLGHLAALRHDATIQHGQHVLVAAPAVNSTEKLLVCARWKAPGAGYAAVYNPTDVELRANLTSLAALPPALSVHHVSHHVKAATNYTNNLSVAIDNVIVPAKSTVVLSYVPNTTAEQ